MSRKKIVIGFSGSIFYKPEIDFVFKFLPHTDMLYVGAVINELEGVPRFMPCQGSSCDEQACRQKKEKKGRQKLYAYLADNCAEAGCRHIIHKEEGCLPHELIRETQYADLLIISQHTYNAKVRTGPEEAPVPFRKLLESAGCPVLVLPRDASEIEQVVMTFDGSANAMRGIKQFSYLLPELGNELPVTVLTTYCEEGPPSLEEKLFIEYLKQHFSNLALHKLSDDTEHTIYSAVGLNTRTLMVVNNPSPQSLPILSELLNREDAVVPLKLITQQGS
jgi:hypothetical protein